MAGRLAARVKRLEGKASEAAHIKSLTDEELEAEIFELMDAYLPAGFFDGLADDPDPAGRALYERIKGKRFSEYSKADQWVLTDIICRGLMQLPENRELYGSTFPAGW